MTAELGTLDGKMHGGTSPSDRGGRRFLRARGRGICRSRTGSATRVAPPPGVDASTMAALECHEERLMEAKGPAVYMKPLSLFAPRRTASAQYNAYNHIVGRPPPRPSSPAAMARLRMASSPVGPCRSATSPPGTPVSAQQQTQQQQTSSTYAFQNHGASRTSSSPVSTTPFIPTPATPPTPWPITSASPTSPISHSGAPSAPLLSLHDKDTLKSPSPLVLPSPLPLTTSSAPPSPPPPPPPTMTSSVSVLPPQTLEQRATPRRALRRRRAVAFALSPDHGRMPPAAVVAANARRHRRVPGDGPDERKFLMASRRQRSPSAAHVGAATVLGAPLQLPPTLRLLGARFAAAATAGLGFAPHADSSSDAGEMLAACLERRRRRRQRKQERGAQGDVRGVPSSSASPPPSTTFLSQPSTSLLSTSVTQSEGAETQATRAGIHEAAENSTNPTPEIPADGSPQRHDGLEKGGEATGGVAVGSSASSLTGAELRATRAHISLPCELDPDAVRRAPASTNVAASELCRMQQELLGILRAVRPAAACTNMLNCIVMDSSTKDQSSDPLETGGLSILSPRLSPEATPAEGRVVRTPSSAPQEGLPFPPDTELSSHSVIGAPPHAIASLTGTMSEESTMITVTDLPHDTDNETEPSSLAQKLSTLRPRDPVRGVMAAAMMMAAATSTTNKTTTAATATTTTTTTTTPASSRTKTTTMIMTTKTTAMTNTATMTVPVTTSVKVADAGSPPLGIGSRKRCWAALREGSAAGEPYGDKASRGTQHCWRQPMVTTAAWGDAANTRAHARVYGDRCDEYEAVPRRRNYATMGDYSWRGYQMESCYSSSCSSAEDMREALGAAGSILAGLKAFVASVSSTSCYSDDEGLFVGLNTDSTTSPPSSMTLVSQEMHVAKVVAVAAAAAAAKSKSDALASERSRRPPVTVGHHTVSQPSSQTPPTLKTPRLRSRKLRSPWPLCSPSSPSYPQDGVGEGTLQTPREGESREREESLDDNDQMTVAAAAVAAAAIAAAAAAELFSDTEGEIDQGVRLSDQHIGRSDSSTGDTSELAKMGPMFSKAAASFMSAGEADLEKMGLTEDALEKMAQRILEDDTSRSDILWPGSQSMLWELSTLAMSSDGDSSSTDEESPSTAIKVMSSRTVVAVGAEPFTYPDDTVASEGVNNTWTVEVPKAASGNDVVAENVNTSNEILKADSKDDLKDDRAQTPLSWVTLSSTVEGTSEDIITSNPLVEMHNTRSSESRHLCEFSTCSVSSNVVVDLEEADTEPVVNSEQTLSDKEESQISENDLGVSHSDNEKKIVSIQEVKECVSETQEECDLETEEDVYVKSKSRDSDVSLTSDKNNSDKNSSNSSEEPPNDDDDDDEFADACFISSLDMSLEDKTYARVESLSTDQIDRTLNFTHIMSECDSRTPQEKTSAAESSTQELTVKRRPMPVEITLADVPPITEEQSLGQAPTSKGSCKRPDSNNTSSGDQTSSFPSYSFSRDTPLSDIKSRSSPLRICIRTVRSSSDSPLSSCEYFPPAFDSFYRKPSGPNIETEDLMEHGSAHSISRQYSDTNTFSSSPLPLNNRYRRVVKRSVSASSSVRHSKQVSACWLSADTEMVDCECTADAQDCDCSRTRLSINSEYSSDMYEVLREYESLGEESAYASGFSDIPEEPDGRKMQVDEIWTEVEVVTKEEETTVLEWQRYSDDSQIRFLQRKRPASCLREDSSSHDDENVLQASPNSQNLVWIPNSAPFTPRLELWKSGRHQLRSRDRSYLYEGFKTCSSPIDVASSVSSFNDPPFINILEGRRPFRPQPCTILSVTETEETDSPPRNQEWESSSQSPSNCELIFTASRATVEPINSDAVTDCLTDVTSYAPMDTVEEGEERRGRDLAQSEFGRLAEALPSAAATRAALMVPTQISRPPLPRDRYRNKASVPSDAEVPKGSEKPYPKGISTTAAGAGAAEGVKGKSSSEWGCDCPDCGCGGDWGRVLRKKKVVNDTSSQESSIVPSEDVFANNPPQLAAAAASRAFIENTPLHGSADPTPPMRVMLKAHRPSTGLASGVTSTSALVSTTAESTTKAAVAVEASESPSSNATPACSTTPSPRDSEPTLPPLSTAITLANAQKEQRGVQLPPMRDSKYAPVCVLNGSVVLHPSDLGYGEPTSSFRPLRDALFPSCVFSSPSSPSIRSSGTSQQPTPGPSVHSLSPRPSNVTGPSPFASYIRPLSGGATSGSAGNVTSADKVGGSATGAGVGGGRGRRCPLNGMAAPYGSGLLDDHHHRSPHGSSLFMPWQFGHSITTSRLPSARNKCGRVRPAARFPRRPPHATSRHRSPAATRSHTPHPHVGGGGGRAGGVHHHRSLGVPSPFGSRTMSPLSPSSHHHHPHPQQPTGRSPHRSSTRTGLHSLPSMSPTRRQQGPHAGRPNSPSSSRWRTPSPSQPSQSTNLSPSQQSSVTSPQPPLLWRSTSPTSTKPGSPGHRPPPRQQPTLWSSKNATGDRRPSSPWSNWRPASPSSPNSGNWRPMSPPLGRRSPTMPSWRQQSSPNSGNASNAWRPASPPSPPPTWRPASPSLSRRPVTPLAQRPVTPSTMMSRPTVAMEIRGTSPPRRSFSPTNLRTKPSRSWTRTGAPPCSSMQPPPPPAWAQPKCQARSPSPGAGRNARRPSSGHALHADAHGPHRPTSPINAASSIGQMRNSCCNNASGDPLHPRSERVLGPLKRSHIHRNVSSPHLSSVSGTDDNSVHMAGAASVISLASISSSTDLVGDRVCGKNPPRRLQSCWLPTERASSVVVPALDKGLGDKALVAPSASALTAPATTIVATATLVGKSYGSGKVKVKDTVSGSGGGGGGGDKASPLTPTRRICVPRLRKLRGSVAAARSSSDRRVRLRSGGEANTNSSLALQNSASALRRRRDAHRLSRLEKKFPERVRDSGGGGEAGLSARTDGGTSAPGSSGLIIGPGAQHAGTHSGAAGVGCTAGSSVDPLVGRLDCSRGVRSDSDGDVKRCGPVMARRRAASRLRRSLPRVPRFLTRSLRRAQRLRGSRWMVVSATDIVHLVKQQKSIGGVSHIIRWETQEYAAKDAQKRRQRGRTPTSTPTPTPTPTSTPPSRRPRTPAQPSTTTSSSPTPPFTHTPSTLRTPLTPRTPTTPSTPPAYLLTPTLFPSDYGRSATSRRLVSDDSTTQRLPATPEGSARRPWSMPTSLRPSRNCPSNEQISSRSNKNLSHSEPIGLRAHKNIINSESMISRANKIFLSSEPTTSRLNKNALNSEPTHHKSHKNRLSNEMARRFSEAVHRSIAIIQRSIQHTIQRSLVEKCIVKKPTASASPNSPTKYANSKWYSWDYPGKGDLDIFEQKAEFNEWKRPTSTSACTCRRGSSTSAGYLDKVPRKTAVFHSLQKCSAHPLKSCCSINKPLELLPKSSVSVEFPRIVQKILDCVNQRPASAQCGKVGNPLNKSRTGGNSRREEMVQEKRDVKKEARLASARAKQSDSSLKDKSCKTDRDNIKILSHPRHESALRRRVRRRAENEVSMILQKTRTYKTPPQFSDDNPSDESKSSIHERCERRRMLIAVKSSSLLSLLDDDTSTSSRSTRNASFDIVPLLPERILKESPSTTSESQYLRTSSESSEGSILTHLLLNDKRVTVPEFEAKPKRYSTSVLNGRNACAASSCPQSREKSHHVCRKLSYPPGVLGRSSKICVIINNLKNPVEYLQCQIRFTNTMCPSVTALDACSSNDGEVQAPSPNVNLNINYKKTKKA